MTNKAPTLERIIASSTEFIDTMVKSAKAMSVGASMRMILYAGAGAGALTTAGCDDSNPTGPGNGGGNGDDPSLVQMTADVDAEFSEVGEPVEIRGSGYGMLSDDSQVTPDTIVSFYDGSPVDTVVNSRSITTEIRGGDATAGDHTGSILVKKSYDGLSKEARDEVAFTLEESNAVPTAKIRAEPLSITAGESVTLSSEESFDSDGSLVQHVMEDASGVIRDQSSPIRFDTTLTEAGMREFKVRVRDDDGAWSSYDVVSVDVGETNLPQIHPGVIDRSLVEDVRSAQSLEGLVSDGSLDRVEVVSGPATAMVKQDSLILESTPDGNGPYRVEVVASNGQGSTSTTVDGSIEPRTDISFDVKEATTRNTIQVKYKLGAINGSDTTWTDDQLSAMDGTGNVQLNSNTDIIRFSKQGYFARQDRVEANGQDQSLETVIFSKGPAIDAGVEPERLLTYLQNVRYEAKQGNGRGYRYWDQEPTFLVLEESPANGEILTAEDSTDIYNAHDVVTEAIGRDIPIEYQEAGNFENTTVINGFVWGTEGYIAITKDNDTPFAISTGTDEELDGEPGTLDRGRISIKNSSEVSLYQEMLETTLAHADNAPESLKDITILVDNRTSFVPQAADQLLWYYGGEDYVQDDPRVGRLKPLRDGMRRNF